MWLFDLILTILICYSFNNYLLSTNMVNSELRQLKLGNYFLNVVMMLKLYTYDHRDVKSRFFPLQGDGLGGHCAN